MRGKWVLISIGVVLVAVGAGALSVLRREAAPRPQPKPSAPAALPAGAEVSLPGKIQAQNVAPVKTEVAGQIEEFAVEVGQEVAEGQLLARVTNKGLESAREFAASAVESAQTRVNRLESSIIAARLEASRVRADASRARGEFDRAEKLYRRQSTLHSQGATPRLVYERSEKEYEKAQSEFSSLDDLAKHTEDQVQSRLQELQNAKKMLEDKTQQLEQAKGALQAAEIHAPVDGLVVSRSGEAGKDIDQGTELFQIATDLSAMQVVIEPEPPVLARLKPGQPALVVVADIQAEGMPGVIKEIKGTQVLVDFTSANPAIKPGMQAQVRLKL